MVSSSEGNPQHRDEPSQETTNDDGVRTLAAADSVPPDAGPQPYSSDDPFRSERIAQVGSEIGYVRGHLSGDDLGRIDEEQAERLLRDAQQRQGWNEAVASRFAGTLRLATVGTPPRSRRIL